MAFLADLWLPILLSAVLVFVVSSVLHMMSPLHKGDYQKLGDEDGVLDAMRSAGVAPGTYMFPSAESMKAMGTPEMIEKYKRGPVGFLTIVPSGAPGMGKNLIAWFLYSVLVSVFAGYLASLALAAGAPYLSVFRMTGTAAVLAYAIGEIPSSIWKGTKWSITCKYLFDGAVYGLVTAGTFAWLWPDA